MVEHKTTPDAAGPSPAPVSPRRQIRLQILAGVVVLLSGVVVGSGGTILLLGDRIMWRPRPHKRRTPAALAEKFRSKYGLNEQQTGKIREILTRGFKQREMIHQQMEQKDRQQRQEFIEQMQQVLTPEQFERWKRDFEARIKRFKQKHRFGGRHAPKQAAEQTDAVNAEQNTLAINITNINCLVGSAALGKHDAGHAGLKREYCNNKIPTDDPLRVLQQL